MLRVLGIDASPSGGGRTTEAVRAVAGTDPIVLVSAGVDTAIDAVASADAVVFGSPIYRASFAEPLKRLLDSLPRGMWGEDRAPIQGKAVAIVATGATLHHFLGLNDLRNVLAGFFAAHVVPPGLYVPRDGFGEDGCLASPYAEAAVAQGQALRELAVALSSSPVLRRLAPQA